MDEIDAGHLYSFGEARAFIRSVQGGSISLETMHRWRTAKRFDAVCRQVGRKRQWFVWGAELIRLLAPEKPVKPIELPRTPTQRAREQALVEAGLKRFYPD